MVCLSHHRFEGGNISPPDLGKVSLAESNQSGLNRA